MGGYFPATVYGATARRRSIAETALLYRGLRALKLPNAVIAHRLGVTPEGLYNAVWRARKRGLLDGVPINNVNMRRKPEKS